MSATDYQLFEFVLRVVAQQDLYPAVGVLLEPVDAIDGNQCTAVYPHERVRKRRFQRFQRFVDEVLASVMVDRDVLLVCPETRNVLDRDYAQLAVDLRADVCALRFELRRRGHLTEHAGGKPRGVLQCGLQARAAYGFEHVTDCARLERFDGVLVVGGREYDGRRTVERIEVLRNLDTVHARHADIE